jgi:hypothetical protein
MRSLLVVFFHPDIEIGLQLFQRPIDPLPERDAIELVNMVLGNRSQIPLVWGCRVFLRV